MLMNSLIKDPALQRRVTPPTMAALTLGMFGLFYARDHAIAFGALFGGGLATIGCTLAMFLRHRADNGFVRGVSGTADERDVRILWQAGACTALSSVVGTMLAMAAIVWGADPMLALGAMAWLQVLTFVVAHVVISRRS